MYIYDVVEANVAALERDTAHGMAVNVGTGVPTTVVTVAHTLSEGYGLPSQMVLRKGRLWRDESDPGPFAVESVSIGEYQAIRCTGGL